MDPITSLHSRPKAWLHHSVLAPYADAFVTYLTHARYSAQSHGKYVASLAHLARWMSQCCLLWSAKSQSSACRPEKIFVMQPAENRIGSDRI